MAKCLLRSQSMGRVHHNEFFEEVKPLFVNFSEILSLDRFEVMNFRELHAYELGIF